MPQDQPAAHQAANAEIDRAASAIKPTVRALYDLLLAEHQNAHVLVWPQQRIISFGVGPKKMSQHYAYIGIQAKHVNLGFYTGSSLPDPSSILEGTGRNLRHVKLVQPSDVHAPAVLALLRSALQQRRARAGTGA